MRKNRFDSDNPMDQFLFCFGSGEDENGGGADKQDRQMDELDQIAADFENMSQQLEAGETVMSDALGGVGFGTDPNDNDGDGIPNAIDRTPGVARGTTTRGFDAFEQSGGYLDRAISDFLTGPSDFFGPGTPDDGARSTVPGSPNDIRNAERQEALKAQQFGIANALQKMGFDPKNIEKAKMELGPRGNIPDKMMGDEERGLFFGELDVLGAEEPDLLDIPTPGGQMLSGLINAIKAPVQTTQQAIVKGATPVTDKYGFTVGATSPTGDVVYDIDPFSFDKSPEMQEAYAKMQAMQEAQRENNGGDQQAAPSVTAPVAPATCPPGYRFNEKTNACEYVGQVYPGATPYSGQPMTASTQYTGIGGLQPFVLQPTYTAQAPFQPLYRV